MQATKWEFENRALIFGLIFGCSFPLYYFDPQNSTVALAEWIAGRWHIDGDHVTRIFFVAAAALLILAAFIRTWASSYLHASVVYATEVQTASLVGDGPYRRVRNPLYFANVLMAIGLRAMMSRPAFVLAVLAMVVFSYRLIFREEAELQAGQGENYERYRKTVPRLWPALPSRVPRSGSKARWSEGFKAESWYWGFALASIVFAITLSLKFFFWILGASIALCWVSSMLLARKSQPSQ